MHPLALLAALVMLPVAAPERPAAPILGGGPVEPGAWPEVVALLYPGGGICTGTLVSDRVVLTAAHCLVGGGPTFVALGDDVTAPDRIVDVARYRAHPDYCGDLVKCKADIWDFGYVELAAPIGAVAPAVALTVQDEWDEAMRAGGTATLVGYGEQEGGDTHIKREVDAPIVRFSATGLEFQAGGDGIDSCYGDSGGPAFVTLRDGAVRLAGVTSRGSEPCGKGGYYGIPSAALCWLFEETGTDLRAGCDACDCLDTTPAEERRCGCRSYEPAGGLLALVLLLAHRRRAR